MAKATVGYRSTLRGGNFRSNRPQLPAPTESQPSELRSDGRLPIGRRIPSCPTTEFATAPPAPRWSKRAIFRSIWTAANLFATRSPPPLSAQPLLPQTPLEMIGIQVGAVSFVDEGVEKVLDEFQQDASINTLFVATFTYGRGIAGRQVPGQPLPDHGKQDTTTARHLPWRQLHQDPSRVLLATPSLQELPRARFRRLRCPGGRLPVGPQARHEDHLLVRGCLEPRDVPNIAQAPGEEPRRQQRHHPLLQQSQLPQLAAGHGRGLRALLRRSTASCGDPSARAPSPMRSARSHGGAAGDPGRSPASASSASARRRSAASTSTARAPGIPGAGEIRPARARGKRPVDGYYVTLWRLMLRYPELLAWEMLWTDSLRETYAAMYNKVKSVKPSRRGRLAHLAQQLVQSRSTAPSRTSRNSPSTPTS